MNAVGTATSTGTVSARDVAAMPADTPVEDMAAIMTASQPNLDAVVLADAAGNAPRSASELLRSADWAEDWLLTLIALEGMLRVATARAEIHGYRGKARSAWQRARQVSNRVAEARTLVDAFRRDARRAENLPPSPTSPLRAARWALAVLHSDEIAGIRRDILAEDGRAELGGRIPTDEEAFFAMVARCDLLESSDPGASGRVLDLDWDDFVDRVKKDVCAVDGIDGILRDPVIVFMWGQALTQIHRETSTLIGIHTDGPGEAFPVLSLNLTGHDLETAERKLRQLRFLASVRARWVEQQHLQRDLKHMAAQQLHAVVAEATNEAIDELTEDHPDEYAWLVDRMTELADPDTGCMPADWRRRRKEVLAGLAERLPGRLAAAS